MVWLLIFPNLFVFQMSQVQDSNANVISVCDHKISDIATGEQFINNSDFTLSLFQRVQKYWKYWPFSDFTILIWTRLRLCESSRLGVRSVLKVRGIMRMYQEPVGDLTTCTNRRVLSNFVVNTSQNMFEN